MQKIKKKSVSEDLSQQQIKFLSEKYDLKEESEKIHIKRKKNPKHVVVTSYSESPPDFDSTNMQYLRYQREICPSTDRLHWQIYSELKFIGLRPGEHYKSDLARLQKEFFPGCHIEMARGDIFSQERYTTKYPSAILGTWAEFGTPTKEGQRFDMEYVQARIFEGASLLELVQDPEIGMKTMKQCHNLADKLIAELKPDPPYLDPYITVFYGPPGSLKSTSALKMFGLENVYKLDTARNRGSIFFQRYKKQSCCLINDPDPKTFTLQWWLKMVSPGPCILDIKNKDADSYIENFLVTTNFDPETEWFKDEPQVSRDALLRRMHIIEIEKAPEFVKTKVTRQKVKYAEDLFKSDEKNVELDEAVIDLL